MNPTQGVPFDLPCGVFDSEGELRRKVYIRPWRAKVKRLLGKMDARKDAGKAVEIILQESIVSIEGFRTVSSALLNDMLGPDREFCALQARIMSRGPIVEADFTCLSCQYRKKGMKLDLSNIGVMGVDEFPLVRSEPEIDVRGKDTGRKVRVFDITVPGGQWDDKDSKEIKATFRIPNGADLKEVAKHVNKNPVAADWSLWSRTCLLWGEQRPPFIMSFWDNLTAYQLEALEDGFAEIDKLGPETVNYVDCDECGDENPVSIYATDFLLRLPRSRTRTR